MDSRAPATLVIGLGLLAAPPAWAQKGKPQPSPCGEDMRLQITIESAGNFANDGPGRLYSPADYRLVPDRDEDYVDGVNKVSATFGIASCGFNLKLNTSTGSRYVQVRTANGAIGTINSTFLNFSRIASVPITDMDLPEFESFCNARVIETTLQTPYPQDNYGGCGQDDPAVPTSDWYVRRYAGGELSASTTRNYKLRYNLDWVYGQSLDGYSGDCTPTATPSLCVASYVRVYHPNATTWIVTPDTVGFDSTNGPYGAPLPPVPNQEALAAFLAVPRRGPLTYVTTESIPFRMVIRKLP